MQAVTVVQQMNTFWFDLCSTYFSCRSLRTFRALFGVGPDICSYVYLKYGEHISKPKHLLWVLNFLKEYNTLHSHASRWDVSTNTFSNVVWSTLQRLVLQMQEVHFLSLNGRLDYKKYKFFKFFKHICCCTLIFFFVYTSLTTYVSSFIIFSKVEFFLTNIFCCLFHNVLFCFVVLLQKRQYRIMFSNK